MSSLLTKLPGNIWRETIPPGSRIYWFGQLSVVPLLYLPGVRIYPAQINGDYSFLEQRE